MSKRYLNQTVRDERSKLKNVRPSGLLLNSINGDLGIVLAVTTS